MMADQTSDLTTDRQNVSFGPDHRTTCASLYGIRADHPSDHPGPLMESLRTRVRPFRGRPWTGTFGTQK
jgi:hypothetical protein